MLELVVTGFCAPMAESALSPADGTGSFREQPGANASQPVPINKLSFRRALILQ
jgi:hypothetical protein